MLSSHFHLQSLSVLASHAPINGSAVLEYNAHNLYGLTQVGRLLVAIWTIHLATF